jgi:hypothetical protein
MSAIALPGALGSADDDALGAGCSCFAFDCHNGKEKKLA